MKKCLICGKELKNPKEEIFLITSVRVESEETPVLIPYSRKRTYIHPSCLYLEAMEGKWRNYLLNYL